ncbi:MAG TPA: hypothetical protein VLD62_06260 [Acidimicrobiia bacterium]|nr:hypothetical protein [Acidimicrobiia bacterium]HSG79167.1 hypothetical protein [Acidimicrobiia bacterium]
MRKAIHTVALSIAAIVLVLNFETRAPLPSFADVGDFDGGGALGGGTTTVPRTTTTGAPPTTTSSVPEEWLDARIYATTTTRVTIPPPTPGRTTTTTTEAPRPTTAGARTFTGPEVDTRFGPIQIQIVVSDDGIIEDVIPLLVPAEYRTSLTMSAWSLRFCERRTIEAQSSKFQKVSGATVTWRGYVESLEGAMDVAGLLP